MPVSHWQFPRTSASDWTGQICTLELAENREVGTALFQWPSLRNSRKGKARETQKASWGR